MKNQIDYEVLDKLSQEQITTLMYYVFRSLKAQYDVDNYKTKLLTDYATKEIWGDLSKLFEFPIEDLADYMTDNYKERKRKEDNSKGI